MTKNSQRLYQQKVNSSRNSCFLFKKILTNNLQMLHICGHNVYIQKKCTSISVINALTHQLQITHKQSKTGHE